MLPSRGWLKSIGDKDYRELSLKEYSMISKILHAYSSGELVEKMSEGDYKAILDKWGEGNNAIPENLGFRTKLARALSKGKVK
jgi:hypothetical protein